MAEMSVYAKNGQGTTCFNGKARRGCTEKATSLVRRDSDVYYLTRHVVDLVLEPEGGAGRVGRQGVLHESHLQDGLTDIVVTWHIDDRSKSLIQRHHVSHKGHTIARIGR